MRIVYGVFGYGRGHATRTMAVLPRLAAHHDILVLAGGDAYEAMSEQYDVVRIPTLAYGYGSSGRLSMLRTFRDNARRVLDVLLRGTTARAVQASMKAFGPDVVIADAEPWTHHAAARLRIPRISFDHYGILAHCRPPIPAKDYPSYLRDAFAYRLLMGNPQRALVSSFYHATPHRRGMRVIGPLLRPEVIRRRATRGDHLLAYFNHGQVQLTEHVEESLQRLGIPVIVYGAKRDGTDRNLHYRAPSTEGFLDDLASCRAIFGTAGNQLVGEAMYLGKPMLVTPEDSVEQRLNAYFIEQLGIGAKVEHHAIRADVIESFLQRSDSLGATARVLAENGCHEAVASLEAYINELTADRSRRFVRAWRYA